MSNQYLGTFSWSIKTFVKIALCFQNDWKFDYDSNVTMMIVSNKNSDLKYSKKNSTNNSRKFIKWPFNNFPAACMCGGLLASWRHWNSHWGVKYHPNKQSIICSAPMVWFLHRKGSQYIYERHSLSVHTFFKQNVSSLFFSNKIQPIVSTSNDKRVMAT